MAYSAAQNEANKRYREKNKEQTNYLRYKSMARGYVNNHAKTIEELEELKNLIDAKIDEFSNELGLGAEE